MTDDADREQREDASTLNGGAGQMPGAVVCARCGTPALPIGGGWQCACRFVWAAEDVRIVTRAHQHVWQAVEVDGAPHAYSIWRCECGATKPEEGT